MAYFSKSYILGLIFIFTCACIWAGASVLIQYIYRDLNFKSPFLVTYLANSLLVFYLPFYQLVSCLGLTKKARSSHQPDVYNPIPDDPERKYVTTVSRTESINGSNSESPPMKQESHMEVIKIAALICPFWFLANCLYNYSLLMTSNSSSTIISNLSAAFTLTFSWLANLEEITYSKLFGIMICFAGAVTVGLQDSAGSDSSQQTIIGDVIALLASAGYGVYTTLLRYKIPDDEGVSMQLVLGYIGMFNAILLSPVLLALYLMGLDNLTHLTGVVFGFIVLNGFADNVFSDYLWARSVVLTSPTVATIGMSITIPLAMISDYLLGNGAPTPISLFGAFLVVVGFLMVNINKDLQEDLFLWVHRQLGTREGSVSLRRSESGSDSGLISGSANGHSGNGYVPVDAQIREMESE